MGKAHQTHQTHHDGHETGTSLTRTRWIRVALGSRWARALIGASLVAAMVSGSVLLVRQARASSNTLLVCAGCQNRSINDALAAAAAGDTVKVLPGTYGPNEPGATTPDTHIAISKPIRLIGSGAGNTIINDAPANQGSATAGVIAITTPGTPGDITISGFTLEGAIVNDSHDDGILMTITDTNASDVITIKNNVFYGDTTLDPSLLADQTDSIYVAGSSATTNITHNTFRGVFRAALVEGNPGPVSFTGNDLNLHGLYDLSVNPPALYFWAEGLLFLGDSGTTIATPQVVSGNTFENYDGMGVGVDAGYPGGLVGAYTNLSITSNVFDNEGVAASQPNPPDAADIYLHGFGTSNGSTTSTISGVTIARNRFHLNSDSGHGLAVRFNGAFGGNNTVDHNLFQGGGDASPLAAISFINLSSGVGISVTNNGISGFVDGVTSDALPTGAQVSVTQNCIAGNSNSGATVAAGASLTADHNWWGAASGPYNATSNPAGTGDAVSDNVSFTPFLTSPSAACANPVHD